MWIIISVPQNNPVRLNIIPIGNRGLASSERLNHFSKEGRPGFKPRLSSSSVHNTLHPGMGFYSPSLKPCPRAHSSTLRPALLAVVFPRPVALPDSPSRAVPWHLLQSPGKRPIGLPRHLPGISPVPCFATAEAALPVFILPAPETCPFITLQRLTSASCYPQQVCPAPPDETGFHVH